MPAADTTNDTAPPEPAGRVVMREPGTGPATWAFGSLWEQLLTAEDSPHLGASLITQPPGTAPPLHRHTREAEAFYVLEGELDYQAGDEHFKLYAGCMIHLPLGVPHTFRIRGEHPAKFLGITTPAGVLQMYDEVGIPTTERRLPGADGQPLQDEVLKWIDLAPHYGLEILGPPLPE